MTTEEKAIETLTWISEYIKNLPNSEFIKEQSHLLSILDKVEATLKGFSNEN